MTTKTDPGPPLSDPLIAEYEKCLLGAYIMGADIGGRVSKDVFVSGAHRVIFQAIKNLKALGVEADLITLVSELEKRRQLDAAGGAAEVAALTNTVPSTANMAFYEAEVLEAYRGRAVWKAAASAKDDLENREDLDTVVTRLTADLEAVTSNSNSNAAAAESGILFSDLLKKQFPQIIGLLTAL